MKGLFSIRRKDLAIALTATLAIQAGAATQRLVQLPRNSHAFAIVRQTDGLSPALLIGTRRFSPDGTTLRVRGFPDVVVLVPR